ncbi:hypothetical protein ACQPUR_23680, partial [Clostridium neonatale]
MQLTATAYFLIPYIIFIAFKKKERIFYNLIFFSALTSISIFNLGNGASSITAFQIISLVLFCRVLLSVLNGSLRVEKKFNKILFAFILICGMSIFLTPYKGEFIVLS